MILFDEGASFLTRGMPKRFCHGLRVLLGIVGSSVMDAVSAVAAPAIVIGSVGLHAAPPHQPTHSLSAASSSMSLIGSKGLFLMCARMSATLM